VEGERAVVTIDSKQEDDSTGIVKFATPEYIGQPGDERWNENIAHNREVFEHRAVLSLAGRAAQARFSKRSLRSYHSTTDHAHLLAMLDHFLLKCDSSEETKAYLRLLEVRTQDLIKQYWPQVEAVARELVERKSMTADEVFAAIAKADPGVV
jgi:hypothetical protein